MTEEDVCYKVDCFSYTTQLDSRLLTYRNQKINKYSGAQHCIVLCLNV